MPAVTQPGTAHVQQARDPMKSAPSGTAVARRARPVPGGRVPLPRPSARSHTMGAGSLAVTERSQPSATAGTGPAQPPRPPRPEPHPAGETSARARAGAWWIRRGPALISLTSVLLGLLCLLDAFSHHHHPAQ